MGEAKKQEGELERELDDLYRKVAGLDPAEEPADLKPPETVAPRSPIRTRLPRRTKPIRTKRRRPRVAPIVWTIAVVLFIAGAMALLYPLAVYRHGDLNVGGVDYPSKTHRLTGETRYFNGDQWLRPPVPGSVTRNAAAQKGGASAGSPGAGRGDSRPGALLSGRPPEAPARAYAIQLRAYPEEQRANAAAFLEELRRREPDASLVTVRITGQGVWHRILVGRFPTAEAAADYRKSRGLDREYPYSFIQTLSGTRP